MQSRLQSFIETCCQTLLGFLIALAAQIWLVPLFGVETSLSQDIGVTMMFTLISLARSYAMRRVFNYLHARC